MSGLPPYERKELGAILKAHRDPAADPALRERFLSDYGDSAAWWLLALLAATGGAVALAVEIWEGLSLYGFWSLRFALGLLACVAVIVGVAVVWIGNHRRRGFAVTSFATIRVKGPRLILVRHADVAGMEWTRHAPPRKQRFSVLRLTATDGKTLTLHVHAGWVRVAIAQIDQARAAAQLPPLEGDARKLPE